MDAPLDNAALRNCTGARLEAVEPAPAVRLRHADRATRDSGCAYDGSQFYRLFSCAAAALARNALDRAVLLQDSERRLRQSFPAD